MAFFSFLKFIAYKESKRKRFELLEDEQEDHRVLYPTKEDTPSQQSADWERPPRRKKQAINLTNARRRQGSGRVKKDSNEQPESQGDEGGQKKSDKELKVSTDISENFKIIRQEFNLPQNADVVVREFKIMRQTDAFLVYLNGMSDKTIINDYILRPLMLLQPEKEGEKSEEVDLILKEFLPADQVSVENKFKNIINLILNGVTAIFINGCEDCLLVDNRSYEKRQVSTPTAETVVRGSQEAFVEDMRTNITLIRRIIKNKDLVTEFIQIGKTDHNVCALMYMKNIVNPVVLQEVRRRITGLDIDFLPDDGMLSQLIEDHPFSLFPQIVSTERPDRACSFLMDGKVLYITNGTPIASAAPATLYHMFHTSEDSSLRWMYGTFIRYIRFIATIIAILLPGMYLALVLFHQEMIPTELLEVLQKARENVPFPSLLEVLILEFTFEIIREGSIRVPGTVGQTMGMVGSIILGQAAVAAGLVSPMVIIIVSLTAMSSFAIPNYSVSFGARILRFFFTLLGAIAGFYGISAGLCIFLGFLCSMHSFGMPFLAPIAPKTKAGSDIIDRAPIWVRRNRPDFLNTINRNRTHGKVREWAGQDEGGKS